MADEKGILFTQSDAARIANTVRIVERSSQGDTGRGQRRIPVYIEGTVPRWAMATADIAAGADGTIRYYTVSGNTWTSTSVTATAYNWNTTTTVESMRRLIVDTVDGRLTIKHYDCP